MKRNLLALAAIAAIASGAQAAPLDRTGAAAATNKLFISGSSALQKLVEGMIVQNCDVDGVSIWRSKSGQTWAGSSTNDSTDGASHNIYACTLKVGNDFGAAYDSQTILVVKREAGGSGQGVFPIGKGLNQLLMNIGNASCDLNANTVVPALPALPYGVCQGPSASSEISVQADMGISDVEPNVFNSGNNKASAFAPFTSNDADFFSTPVPVGQAVMGLIVNGALYSALQADQGTAGVPSISATAFSSLMTGSYPTAEAWTPLFSAGSAAALKNTHINIAFRAIGSGTRASAGLYFNNTPSGKVNKNFATGVTTNTFNGLVDGGRSVFNASSSGNVIGAVDGCGAARYCVGILGLEQNIAGKDAQFVRVDGNLPANAKLGQYGVVYESTTQISKTGVNGAAGQALAGAFTTAVSKPVNINFAFSTGGFLALPGACSGTSFSTWVGDEAAVCSRMTRFGNSNNVLTIVK